MTGAFEIRTDRLEGAAEMPGKKCFGDGNIGQPVFRLSEEDRAEGAIKTGKKSGKKSAAKKSNKPKKSKQSSALRLGRAKTARKVAKKRRPKKAKR
jgi:hypothetical protein